MLRQVAVFTHTYDNVIMRYVEELILLLKENGIRTYMHENIKKHVKPAVFDSCTSYSTSADLPADTDLLISVGGDGTILRSVQFVLDKDIPVLGINAGRMGFLATVHKDQMKEAIADINAGKFSYIHRSMLEVKISGRDDTHYCLNEISVSRKNTTNMIQVDAFINGEKLNRYWADGLIIATPTGSTGYSLSCNGPIVAPDLPAIILTPIAPHSLNVRPLLINDRSNIRLSVHSREPEFLLSVDSHVLSLPLESIITIEKAKQQVRMLRLNDRTFIQTLKEKLLWGSDSRNY